MGRSWPLLLGSWSRKLADAAGSAVLWKMVLAPQFSISDLRSTRYSGGNVRRRSVVFHRRTLKVAQSESRERALMANQLFERMSYSGLRPLPATAQLRR